MQGIQASNGMIREANNIFHYSLDSAVRQPSGRKEELARNDRYSATGIGNPDERTKDKTPERNEPISNLIRVLVHYRNSVGKALVKQHAHAVYHEFDDEKSIAVGVKPRVLERLESNFLINRVEHDSIWIEQGYLERIVDEGELRDGSYWRKQQPKNGRLRHRKLEEVMPYGISMVQADQVSVGKHPVTVCIIDTGLAINHPDIDSNRAHGVDRESNIVNETIMLHWDADARGHGTHVAGTVAAKANNGIGVRGIGELNVFITRGLDDQGSAYESDIREAFEQCEAAGAKIINLSLGGTEMSSSMKAICDRLYSKDFLIFAAAGNGGEWSLEYPASDPTVISVSAVDSTEWFWANSNYGSTLELMAPGHLILSTTVNETGHFQYAEYSGTSMATPHASGVAALVWSHFPNCTNQQIRYALAYSAKGKYNVCACVCTVC
jgi:hypothetical protein